MHCRKMFKAEIPFSNVMNCEDGDKVWWDSEKTHNAEWIQSGLPVSADTDESEICCSAHAVTLTASSCGHVIVSVIGRGGCCARRQRSWGTGPPRRLTRPRAARGHGSTATSAVWSRPGRRSPTRLTCTASRSPTETRSESAGWEPVTASCAWWTEYGLMHVSELLE